MHSVAYYIAKIKCKIFRSNEPINNYYRRKGVKIGEGCLLCSSPLTSESCLIEIKNNVVVSTEVSFVTHDHSIKYVIPEKSNLFGKIIIGNNCFIGQRSILMYGVELADNIIVAAGSVVTKSFYDSDIIIGGNPAKVIGTWERFREKNTMNAMTKSEFKSVIKSNADDNRLIKR